MTDHSLHQIMVVSSLTPPATANYVVHSLHSSGRNVFVCSDVAGDNVNFLSSGPVDVAEIAMQHGIVPDLVIFIEGGTMRLLPVGMEKLSCMTAWYGIDTHMDYEKHLRIGRLFDITFVAQKEYVERLKAAGLRQVYWLPLAFAPELLPSEIPKRCYDLAYVGSDNAVMHPVRHDFLNALRQHFPSHWFGMASPSEMINIYSQSKIVFNKSVNNDVNMRYFEAMGSGAVLVTDSVCANGVEDLFVKNRHFFEYTDQDSLIYLIDSLLKNPEQLRSTSEDCCELVMARHTYEHRMETLLEIVGQSQKLRPPHSDEYFAAFAALRMTSAALHAAAQTLQSPKHGRARKYQAKILSIIWHGLARANLFVDSISAVIRGR